MKFRGMIAACMAGALLLPTGCADDKAKMESCKQKSIAEMKKVPQNLRE